ncbi:hypothetical protein [Streptomyces laculatispora]|uniref:hypothetical protein n=1 Tax=Streptomyces laculatispora TaxID=887464 RepID=UPI003515F832
MSILNLDMSFDDARVPGQGQAGDHSIPVAFQPCGEGVETGKVVLSDGVEPIRQTLALALGQHGREGPDVAGEGGDLRAVGRDGLELELLGLAESLGAAEDPSGDRAGRRRSGRSRPWRCPFETQVGADARVAPLVAEGNDLLPQLPGIGAA